MKDIRTAGHTFTAIVKIYDRPHYDLDAIKIAEVEIPDVTSWEIADNGHTLLINAEDNGTSKFNNEFVEMFQK